MAMEPRVPADFPEDQCFLCTERRPKTVQKKVHLGVTDRKKLNFFACPHCDKGVPNLDVSAG